MKHRRGLRRDDRALFEEVCSRPKACNAFRALRVFRLSVFCQAALKTSRGIPALCDQWAERRRTNQEHFFGLCSVVAQDRLPIVLQIVNHITRPPGHPYSSPILVPPSDHSFRRSAYLLIESSGMVRGLMAAGRYALGAVASRPLRV